MVFLWGICGVLLVLAISQSARSNDARRKARAGFLDQCLPLFTQPITAVAETGFARISGKYCGQMFDVQVVPDSLSVRKLPCLWLLVTVVESLPLAGTFDVMLRATGTETFSRYGELPDQISAPSSFPDDCSIRTDVRGPMQAIGVISRYLSGLDKARLKELVIAPKGLRLVWLLEQADRGRYLLFRDAEMGSQPLPPAVVLPLMDGLCVLWGDVMAQINQHG
jgi:hypothetical protein